MKERMKICRNIHWNGTILAFILLIVFSGIVFADQHFLSATNGVNILLKAAKNGGLLAIGMTFVILIGEIDLSVGAVLAVSGVVMGMVGEVNPFLGIIAGLLSGVISGSMIGFMVTKMGISSWIASLSMMFALRGMVSIVSHQSITIENAILRFANIKFFKGFFGIKAGISVLIPIFLVLLMLCIYIAKWTKFGMHIYAVGGNKEAARMMGIDVDGVIMKTFIISGVIASFSGMLLASASGSAALGAGNIYETYAIAMCAIGGVKLSGGEGKLIGAFFGILIYFVINTLFTYLSGVSVHWQSVIMGIMVLLSVIGQSEVLHNFKGIKRGKSSL